MYLVYILLLIVGTCWAATFDEEASSCSYLDIKEFKLLNQENILHQMIFKHRDETFCVILKNINKSKILLKYSIHDAFARCNKKFYYYTFDPASTKSECLVDTDWSFTSSCISKCKGDNADSIFGHTNIIHTDMCVKDYKVIFNGCIYRRASLFADKFIGVYGCVWSNIVEILEEKIFFVDGVVNSRKNRLVEIESDSKYMGDKDDPELFLKVNLDAIDFDLAGYGVVDLGEETLFLKINKPSEFNKNLLGDIQCSTQQQEHCLSYDRRIIIPFYNDYESCSLPFHSNWDIFKKYRVPYTTNSFYIKKDLNGKTIYSFPKFGTVELEAKVPIFNKIIETKGKCRSLTNMKIEGKLDGGSTPMFVIFDYDLDFGVADGSCSCENYLDFSFALVNTNKKVKINVGYLDSPKSLNCNCFCNDDYFYLNLTSEVITTELRNPELNIEEVFSEKKSFFEENEEEFKVILIPAIIVIIIILVLIAIYLLKKKKYVLLKS